MTFKIESLANDAYEAVRGMNHAMPAAVPAPALYTVLGNLKHAGGHFLAEALQHLADGIEASLDEYDVRMDDGSDPRLAAFAAAAALRDAADLAGDVGRLLEEAHSAIAYQSAAPRPSVTRV